jgi:hypothetical protein
LDLASTGCSAPKTRWTWHRLLRLVRLSDGVKQDIELADDMLFILGPRTNKLWKHTIVKTAKAVQPRLSLTYRAISSGC